MKKPTRKVKQKSAVSSPAKTRPAPRARKPRKRWGLLLVAVSVITFIVLQILITSVLLAGYTVEYIAQLSNSTDPNAITSTLNSILSDQAAFGSLLTSFTNWLQQTPWALYTVQGFLYLPWIAFMFYATYRKGLKSFRKEFWLRFKRFDLPLGIAIAIGLTAFELLVQFVLGKVLGLNLTGADNGTPLFQSKGIWLYVTTFGIGGIIGPFFEELYFRGFVMQGFIRYFRKGLRTQANTPMGANIQAKLPGLYRVYTGFKHWLYKHKYSISVILTAIFFGLMHTQFPASGQPVTFGQILVPVITGSIGLVLGYIAVKTRRLGINIFTHMSFNTIAVILAFLPISF